MLIDLDELPVLHRRLHGFSWNRFNVLSVHDKDFGIDESRGLRGGVEDALLANGITEKPAKLFLSCYPRVFGYAFNPLSVYYCSRDDGVVFAIIYEVHNTFGERHVYVLPVPKPSNWIQQTSEKALFVSPFTHMSMQYRFRLNVPGDTQIIAIRLHDEQGLVLTASYAAKQIPLSAKALASQVLKMPLLSLKVISGIHWEAVRLWLKRVPWFSHVPKTIPPPPLTKTER